MQWEQRSWSLMCPRKVTEEPDYFAEYHRLKAEFEAAGIPWNKKGSPHGIWLRAKKALAQISFSDIVQKTMNIHSRQLAENVTANNALFSRLSRRR